MVNPCRTGGARTHVSAVCTNSVNVSSWYSLCWSSHCCCPNSNLTRSIRFVLTMILSNGWSTKQVDYTNAFAQAKLISMKKYTLIPPEVLEEQTVFTKFYDYSRASMVWSKLQRLSLTNWRQVWKKGDFNSHKWMHVSSWRRTWSVLYMLMTRS